MKCERWHDYSWAREQDFEQCVFQCVRAYKSLQRVVSRLPECSDDTEGNLISPSTPRPPHKALWLHNGIWWPIFANVSRFFLFYINYNVCSSFGRWVRGRFPLYVHIYVQLTSLSSDVETGRVHCSTVQCFMLTSVQTSFQMEWGISLGFETFRKYLNTHKQCWVQSVFGGFLPVNKKKR